MRSQCRYLSGEAALGGLKLASEGLGGEAQLLRHLIDRRLELQIQSRDLSLKTILRIIVILGLGLRKGEKRKF